MTTFNDRKDAFEKKFAHDEELRFKAMARRNKLFGLWAAGQLGHSGPEAEARTLRPAAKLPPTRISAAPWTSSSRRPWKR
jgi:hypothetical protein